MRAFARLVTAGLWGMIGLGSAAARAQPLPAASTGPPAALQVPYLPQSVLLCGGAAVAMVERWWGRRGVYAQDFADLVRPAEGGILTTDLVPATRRRSANPRQGRLDIRAGVTGTWHGEARCR